MALGADKSVPVAPMRPKDSYSPYVGASKIYVVIDIFDPASAPGLSRNARCRFWAGSNLCRPTSEACAVGAPLFSTVQS